MAGFDRPEDEGKAQPGGAGKPAVRDEELERRGRDLEAAIAARRAADDAKVKPSAGSRDMAGFGQAMKLSSEFVAGVAVGAGMGWLIDRLAGTSPWGLIIFLLLGFCAGVLNVLRAAGKIAEPKPGVIGRKENE